MVVRYSIDFFWTLWMANFAMKLFLGCRKEEMETGFRPRNHHLVAPCRVTGKAWHIRASEQEWSFIQF